MSHSYLHEDDSFEYAHAGRPESYLFVRRVARQVAMETDKTVAAILGQLGVCKDGHDDDLITCDGERLQELEDQLTELILNICRRKTA